MADCCTGLWEEPLLRLYGLTFLDLCIIVYYVCSLLIGFLLDIMCDATPYLMMK